MDRFVTLVSRCSDELHELGAGRTCDFTIFGGDPDDLYSGVLFSVLPECDCVHFDARFVPHDWRTRISGASHVHYDSS